ncbi:MULTISPECIES: diiron oxygenase [unclassified Gordonia (in: high G+C Gram-positive bacteria)]|uniref:AurF N-oxygenase family protein n=1 Tax=unclassified Gordonia (in: high G+C Gram-positive bacteria) TaxID=2657482 RepID=UPI0010F7B47E|nr:MULTISPECIES: diiron oxygenase [unclassified Gordonia (in: high G+C Gram-positive bacteria)]
MTKALTRTDQEHEAPARYVPQHDKTGGDHDFAQVLDDLSAASVHRNFDPYVDIDWDAPDMAIVENDPRWILSYEVDPIGRHPWYQQLPQEKQIEIGMWRQANVAKVGLQFESVLIRGLMQYSFKLPNGAREFRYTTHESKEECNHTLMFQEFVNRTGMDVPGAKLGYRLISPLVPLFSTIFPTVFFFGVLGGEEPIDHIQKDFLRTRASLHPTMAAVMQLHVAEEARHISFAHHLIREQVPQRGRVQRFLLSLMLPLTMRILCGAIVVPPRSFAKRFDVPHAVMKDIFWRSPESKRFLRNVFGDVRMLGEQSGLMNPVSRLLWRALGISGRPSRFRSEPTYTAA